MVTKSVGVSLELSVICIGHIPPTLNFSELWWIMNRAEKGRRSLPPHIITVQLNLNFALRLIDAMKPLSLDAARK